LAEVIRDGHNKGLHAASSTPWIEQLAELQWRTHAVEGAILPDSVALSRERDQTFVPLLFRDDRVADFVVLPIAHHRLLVGIGSGVEDVPVDVQEINRASALCSTTFFISNSGVDPSGLEGLIGRRTSEVIQKAVREASVFNRGRSDVPSESTFDEATDVASASGTFTFSVACVDYGNSETLERLSELMRSIVSELSLAMPLDLLHGITFATDYPSALETLDRGAAHLRTQPTEPRSYGRAVAKCVQVIRDGVSKQQVMLDAIIATSLLGDDEEAKLEALQIIVAKLADVAFTALYEVKLAGQDAQAPDVVAQWLQGAAAGAPSDYFSAKVSAFANPGAAQRYATLIQDSLAAAVEPVREAKVAFAKNLDVPGLVRSILPHVAHVVCHAAQWLGHRDGLPEENDGETHWIVTHLQEQGLDKWFDLLGRDLRRLYDGPDQFSYKNLYALSAHVERLLWTMAVLSWPLDDGQIYFLVPSSEPPSKPAE
jgi:hypothetical protein